MKEDKKFGKWEFNHGDIWKENTYEMIAVIPHYEECQANGKLIAAAPDLLEALQLLLSLQGKTDLTSIEYLEDAKMIAQAAILKATL